jgi:hypothetical protein
MCPKSLATLTLSTAMLPLPPKKLCPPDPDVQMTQYSVVIPDEKFAMLEWEDEGLPAICAVNQSLANFESKFVFAWHLSIIVELVELAGNGMPTANEKPSLTRSASTSIHTLRKTATQYFSHALLGMEHANSCTAFTIPKLQMRF